MYHRATFPIICKRRCFASKFFGNPSKQFKIRNYRVFSSNSSVEESAIATTVTNYGISDVIATHPQLIQFFEHFFLNVHSYTSLPWYIAIPVTTFLFRSMITLPASIYQQHAMAKTAQVNFIAEPVRMDVANRLRLEGRRNGWSYPKFLWRFRGEV